MEWTGPAQFPVAGRAAAGFIQDMKPLLLLILWLSLPATAETTNNVAESATNRPAAKAKPAAPVDVMATGRYRIDLQLKEVARLKAILNTNYQRDQKAQELAVQAGRPGAGKARDEYHRSYHAQLRALNQREASLKLDRLQFEPVTNPALLPRKQPVNSKK